MFSKYNIKLTRKPLILLVDDTESNIQVLASLLANQDYDLTFASDGKTAIQSIQEAKPDLILLDIMMPEMDGYETCEIIKHNPETSDIPVIFLTAKTQKEDVLKGFEVGGADYITKPFNEMELLARIQTHLKLKLSLDYLIEANEKKDKCRTIFNKNLRDPFTSLLSLSQMIEQSADKMQPKEIQNIARILFNAAQQTFSIFENIMTWSAITLNQSSFIPKRINPYENIEEIKKYLTPIANKKNISISIIKGTEDDVFVDNDLFNKVVYSILHNAIKYSYPNSNIGIGFSVCKNEDFVKFFILDKGVGISDYEKQLLFNIESNYAKSGTSGEIGTGISLIICKEIVEAVGGELWFEDTEGGGVTFYFTFPKFLE
jgi:two-component system sensor histidine kinase/response regulator